MLRDMLAGCHPIVIENLTVGVMIGTNDRTRMFVAAASTTQGQAVLINNFKVARFDKEL